MESEDPGVYYVYEDGKLRTSKGVPVKHTHSVQVYEDEEEGEKNLPASLTFIQGSGYHQPPRLLTLATFYVADHLQHVESLVDFPAIVGEQLLKAAVDRGYLSKPSAATKATIDLFSQAYDSDVLSCLTLAWRPKALPHVMEGFGGFWHLTGLSLAGCRLGDDHHILGTIGQTCDRLTELSLSQCDLTSTGTRSLTLPTRMMSRGPANLTRLDVSGNRGLGDTAVKHITAAYTRLHWLNVSNCNVTDTGSAHIKQTLGLCEMTEDSSQDWENRGWLADVISAWINSTPDEEVETQSAGFYGNKTKKKKTCDSNDSEIKLKRLNSVQRGRPLYFIHTSLMKKVSNSQANKQVEKDKSELKKENYGMRLGGSASGVSRLLGNSSNGKTSTIEKDKEPQKSLIRKRKHCDSDDEGIMNGYISKPTNGDSKMEHIMTHSDSSDRLVKEDVVTSDSDLVCTDRKTNKKIKMNIGGVGAGDIVTGKSKTKFITSVNAKSQVKSNVEHLKQGVLKFGATKKKARILEEKKQQTFFSKRCAKTNSLEDRCDESQVNSEKQKRNPFGAKLNNLSQAKSFLDKFQ